MTSIITPIKKPFAFNRNDNVAPTFDNPNNDVVSQPNGFPINQMLARANPAWQAVKEPEVNGTFNFYTSLLHQLGRGGKFTFDDNLVATNGGYDAGAILWDDQGKTFLRSTIDNNTVNFITNRSSIGNQWIITSDGIGITDYINDNSAGKAGIKFGNILCLEFGNIFFADNVANAQSTLIYQKNNCAQQFRFCSMDQGDLNYPIPIGIGSSNLNILSLRRSTTDYIEREINCNYLVVTLLPDYA